MKVPAEVFKMPAFSEILPRIAEFKLQIAIPFTIEPIKKKNDKDGTRAHARRHQWINNQSP